MASTGAIIGTVAIALAMMSVRTLAMPRLCYWGITLFLMMGILLGPAPLLFSRINSFGAYTVNQAADSCFGLFMWMRPPPSASGSRPPGRAPSLFIRAGWAADSGGTAARSPRPDGRRPCAGHGVRLHAGGGAGGVLRHGSRVQRACAHRSTMDILPLERRGASRTSAAISSSATACPSGRARS
ncbi:MAG: hypothetical protein ACLTDR_04520 [Adlercreutzia equolifaciens]